MAKQFARITFAIVALGFAAAVYAEKTDGKKHDAGPHALGWYDSNGTFVATATSEVAGLAKIDGDIVYLRFGPRLDQRGFSMFTNGTAELASGSLWFATTDCTGPAYLRLDGTSGITVDVTQLSAVIRNGDSAVLYMGGSTYTTGQVYSYLHSDSINGVVTPICGAPAFPGPNTLYPVQSSKDLSSLWTPPFTLK
jgi:hypothetical protein